MRRYFLLNWCRKTLPICSFKKGNKTKRLRKKVKLLARQESNPRTFDEGEQRIIHCARQPLLRTFVQYLTFLRPRDKLFKMAQKMQTYDEMSTTGISTEYHGNPKIMCCVLLTLNAIMIFGVRGPQYFISHTKSQRLLVMRHRLSREKVNLHNTPVTSAWDACGVSGHVGLKLLFWVHDFCPLNFLYAVIQNVHTSRREMP